MRCLWNFVESFSFIAWIKYIAYGLYTAKLVYNLVLMGIIVFMAIIYPETVVTKEYVCAYVGNICPMLDQVLRLGCLASLRLSVTEVCTNGCCSYACCCIGYLWLSYYCTVTDACSSDYGELSLVVRPWPDIEMNVFHGSFFYIISFYKPKHGLTVAGRKNISIVTIDSG